MQVRILNNEDAYALFLKIVNGVEPEQKVEIENRGVVYLEKPKPFTSEGQNIQLDNEQLRIYFENELGE